MAKQLLQFVMQLLALAFLHQLYVLRISYYEGITEGLKHQFTQLLVYSYKIANNVNNAVSLRCNQTQNYKYNNNNMKKRDNRIEEKQRNLRKKIVYFFLSLSEAQQRIQQAQQQLLSHPCYNPILLFKKISNGDSTMNRKQFVRYVLRSVGMPKQVVKAYMRKHRFGRTIQCEQFISSMIPYSPNILRICHETIILQIQSSPKLQQDLEQLYQHLLWTQIRQIMTISYYFHQIGIHWQSIRKIIQKDIQNRCAYIDTRIQILEIDVVQIRKWMEIWINVDEKDILRIMRWIGGAGQKCVSKAILFFSDIEGYNYSCNCMPIQDVKLKKQKQRQTITSLSIAPVGRLNSKQQQFLSRKISYISQKRSVSSSRYRSPTRSLSLAPTPSTPTQVTASSLPANHQKIQKCMSIWCQYIYVLLNGQRELSQMRSKIEGKDQEVVGILKKCVMNSKSNVTRMSKILDFVEKFGCGNRNPDINARKYLNELLISNDVLLSIFNTNPSKIKLQDCYGLNQQIKSEIAQILRLYCQTKSNLIKLSKQILSNNFQQTIFKLLTKQKRSSISRQDLTKILQDLRIDIEAQTTVSSTHNIRPDVIQQTSRQVNCHINGGMQKKIDNLEILIKHFGNGDYITLESFQRVFRIQGL